MNPRQSNSYRDLLLHIWWVLSCILGSSRESHACHLSGVCFCMISVIVGKPGAGKSYESVRIALLAAHQGRVVVTNLPLLLEHEDWQAVDEAGLLVHHPAEDPETRRVYFSALRDWTDAQSKENMRTGKNDVQLGPLILIDEVGTCFAAMTKEQLEEVRVLLSKHRHSLADYYLIVQSHTHLPMEVKPLVESWVELSSMKAGGLPGYHYQVYTTWYGNREALSQGMRRYDKRRFDLYDTHALGHGANYNSDESTTLYDRWPVYLKPALTFPPMVGHSSACAPRWRPAPARPLSWAWSLPGTC